MAPEEVELEQLNTEDMFADILTKPVIGAQFEKYRFKYRDVLEIIRFSVE